MLDLIEIWEAWRPNQHLKLFHNILAGCIILLREATAIREYRCYWITTLFRQVVRVKVRSTWMPGPQGVPAEINVQSITLLPLACFHLTVHSGAVSFPGKWHTQHQLLMPYLTSNVFPETFYHNKTWTPDWSSAKLQTLNQSWLIDYISVVL